MKVSEIFESIQGEGPFAGTPALFVRTQGCSVGCEWCDTRYTWARDGPEEPVEALLVRVRASKQRLVVLTGGEPLEQEDTPAFLAACRQERDVQVETSGLLPRPASIATFVVAPKLEGATPRWAETWRHLRSFNWRQDWVKVTCRDRAECVEAVRRLKEWDVPAHRTYLMPRGATADELRTSAPEVWHYCVEHGLLFSGRLQTWTFGPKRRV